MNELLTIIKPHPSKKISDEIRGKQGYINLTVGMPHFGPSKTILKKLKQLAEESLQLTCANFNKYADSRGLCDLRNAVAERYTCKYDFKPNPDYEILITNGCAEAIWLTIFTTTNIGDEVIIPDPCYMLYEPIIITLGRFPVRIKSDYQNNFALDINNILDAITPKTRLIIINSPANPTGMMYSVDILKALCSIAYEKNIYIMHDEVFDDFVFQNYHIPIVTVSKELNNLIMVNSFSKRLGITGWRLGWLMASKKIIDEALKAHTFNNLAINALSQEVIASTMNNVEVINEILINTKKLQNNLNSFYANLKTVEGFECDVVPQGGMYLFPNISKIYNKIPIEFKTSSISESVAKFILHKCKIAVVPGIAFGRNGEGHIRISVAAEEQELLEAIGRLKCLF